MSTSILSVYEKGFHFNINLDKAAQMADEEREKYIKAELQKALDDLSEAKQDEFLELFDKESSESFEKLEAFKKQLLEMINKENPPDIKSTAQQHLKKVEDLLEALEETEELKSEVIDFFATHEQSFASGETAVFNSEMALDGETYTFQMAGNSADMELDQVDIDSSTQDYLIDQGILDHDGKLIPGKSMVDVQTKLTERQDHQMDLTQKVQIEPGPEVMVSLQSLVPGGSMTLLLMNEESGEFSYLVIENWENVQIIFASASLPLEETLSNYPPAFLKRVTVGTERTSLHQKLFKEEYEVGLDVIPGYTETKTDSAEFNGSEYVDGALPQNVVDRAIDLLFEETAKTPGEASLQATWERVIQEFGLGSNQQAQLIQTLVLTLFKSSNPQFASVFSGTSSFIENILKMDGLGENDYVTLMLLGHIDNPEIFQQLFVNQIPEEMELNGWDSSLGDTTDTLYADMGIKHAAVLKYAEFVKQAGQTPLADSSKALELSNAPIHISADSVAEMTDLKWRAAQYYAEDSFRYKKDEGSVNTMFFGEYDLGWSEAKLAKDSWSAWQEILGTISSECGNGFISGKRAFEIMNTSLEKLPGINQILLAEALVIFFHKELPDVFNSLLKVNGFKTKMLQYLEASPGKKYKVANKSLITQAKELLGETQT